MVSNGHPASSDVSEKLSQLEEERKSLLELWETRRVLYEQCMDLQLFYRDSEQAEAWMAKQEAILDNKDVGDSLDSVEALLRKHQDFEKSLAAQEEKIKRLDEFAEKLIDNEHYASEEIKARREELVARRSALSEKSSKRRRDLDDSHKYQLFDRDADEMKSWIVEKLKTASDESYKDPTNLQVCSSLLFLRLDDKRFR